MFSTLLHITYTQWSLEVGNWQTSTGAEYLPWWCPAKPLLEPHSTPAWTFPFKFLLQHADWLGHSRIFHFLVLRNSSVTLAVCLGSLSCCRMKCCPMNLEAFTGTWADKTFPYISKFIHKSYNKGNWTYSWILKTFQLPSERLLQFSSESWPAEQALLCCAMFLWSCCLVSPIQRSVHSCIHDTTQFVFGVLSFGWTSLCLRVFLGL